MHKMLKLKIFVLYIYVLLSDVIKCEELVNIENGLIRGIKHENYISFEGIPYAEPPIGENRFEPAKPLLKTWDGILEANKFGASCLQWDHFILDSDDQLRGSEDCLFLNVYTPKINPEKKYSVVLYFHGGAFMFGQGDFYGPQNLLQKDLIFVNINYRLGPLGFLSTEDNVVPGNMGLKDQNLALKWVKKNIEHFGGDPDKITLVGYSAGGASVNYHYMSKLSRGLFQSGISHSGVAINPWAMQDSPLEKAKMIAKNVGCTTCCTKKLIKCLKEKSADDIVRSVKILQPWLYNPFSPFGPVVEPESDTAFISASPLEIIEKGDLYNVPWLASACDAEGIYPAGQFVGGTDNEYLIELENNWNEIAPHLLDFNWTIPTGMHNELSDKIRKFYMNDKQINFDTIRDVVKIISDRLYFNGIFRTLKLQSQKMNSPIYFYYYKFPLVYGVENAFSLRDDVDLGVGHGDDLLLLLKTVIHDEKHPYTENELVMQKHLLEMYFKFIDQGIAEWKGIRFEQFHTKDPNTFRYLEIVDPDNFSFKNLTDLSNEKFWKDFS